MLVLLCSSSVEQFAWARRLYDDVWRACPCVLPFVRASLRAAKRRYSSKTGKPRSL